MRIGSREARRDRTDILDTYDTLTVELDRADGGNRERNILNVLGALGCRNDDDPVVVPLLAGAGAATVAWAVGYPADLIKTRIQADPSNHQLTIMQTVNILRAEANGSWLALYRGFGLKLVRSVPASMIGFTVYEGVKRYVLEVL